MWWPLRASGGAFGLVAFRWCSRGRSPNKAFRDTPKAMRDAHFRQEIPGEKASAAVQDEWLQKAIRYMKPAVDKGDESGGAQNARPKKMYRLLACDHLVAVDSSLRTICGTGLKLFAPQAGDDDKDISQLPLYIPMEDRLTIGGTQSLEAANKEVLACLQPCLGGVGLQVPLECLSPSGIVVQGSVGLLADRPRARFDTCFVPPCGTQGSVDGRVADVGSKCSLQAFRDCLRSWGMGLQDLLSWSC